MGSYGRALAMKSCNVDARPISFPDVSSQNSNRFAPHMPCVVLGFASTQMATRAGQERRAGAVPCLPPAHGR